VKKAKVLWGCNVLADFRSLWFLKSLSRSLGHVVFKMDEDCGTIDVLILFLVWVVIWSLKWTKIWKLDVSHSVSSWLAFAGSSIFFSLPILAVGLS
jgi:hypothetical protein